MFIFLKRPQTSPTPSSVVVSQLPPRRRHPTSPPPPQTPPPPPPTSPKAAHPFQTTFGTSQQSSRPRRPRPPPPSSPTTAVSRPRYTRASMVACYPKWSKIKCSQLTIWWSMWSWYRLYCSTLKFVASVILSLQDSPSQNVAAEDYTDTSLSADADCQTVFPTSAGATVAVAEWVPAGGGQVQGGRHRHGGGRRAALRGRATASEAARVRQGKQTEDQLKFCG